MLALLTTVATGCGGRAAPPTVVGAAAPPAPAFVPVEPPAIAPVAPAVDWAALDLRQESALLAAWQRLGLRGDSWEATLAEVPDDPALLQALSLAQLHHADLACPSQGRATGCADDPGVFEAAPEAGWDDPCLQRQLALWSVAQLEWPDLAAEPALLLRLVTRPRDVDLAAAALEATEDMPTELKVQLITAAVEAGNEAAIGAALHYLPLEELRALALRLHLEEAFALLVAEPDEATFLAAVRDEQLASATRIALIDELLALAEAADATHLEADAAALAPDLSDLQVAHALGARAWKRRLGWPLTAALTALVRQGEPLTAAHAARTLSVLGHADPLRLLGAPRSPDELIRQLRLRYALDASVQPLLAPRGLEVTEQLRTPPELAPDQGGAPDDDGDGDPWLQTTQRRVDVDGDSYLPFGEQLLDPGQRCGDGRCVSRDATVISFDAIRRGAGYVLRGITRNDPGQCGDASALLLRTPLAAP
jgi:hypothetical protein